MTTIGEKVEAIDVAATGLSDGLFHGQVVKTFPRILPMRIPKNSESHSRNSYPVLMVSTATSYPTPFGSQRKTALA